MGAGCRACAALLVLKERTRFECRENTEQINVTEHRQNQENPNHGNTRETKKNKGTFLWKGSTAALGALACSQNKGSCPSEYQTRVSQLPFAALLGGGEAGA